MAPWLCLKVQPGTGLVSSEASPGDADGRLLPASSQGHPPVHVCVLLYSSYKDTGPIGLGPAHMPSFYLIVVQSLSRV